MDISTSLQDQLLTEGLKVAVKELVGRALKAMRPGTSPSEIDDLEDSLASYSERACRTAAFTKNIIYKNQPVKLDDIYEPLDIVSGDRHSAKGTKRFASAGMAELEQCGNAVLVSGTAGAGKTTFLRHIFLDVLRAGRGTPILIELRKLNGTRQTLRQLAVATIDEALPAELFDSMLSVGNVVVLFDGFDELEANARASVLGEIVSLVDAYPNCRWVLSSRPDPILISLGAFTEVRPVPLRKEQALSLVAKLEYDVEKKLAFSKNLDAGIYDKYVSFTSNPLLLLILFLTFSESGAIEFKRKSFYYDAFLALYNRHDSTKGAYQREFHCTLSRDELERVLEAISIQTFLSQRRELTSLDVNDVLSKAREMTGLTFDSEAMRLDLLQSVCLWVQDGLQYTYSHRSFEEFFAARFIYHTPDRERAKILRSVASRSIRENVCVQILYELSPDVVENEILIPAIDKILGKTNDLLSTYLTVTYRCWADRMGETRGELSEGGFRQWLYWLIDELEPLFPARKKAPRKECAEEDRRSLVESCVKGGRLVSVRHYCAVVASNRPSMLAAVETHLEVGFGDIEWLFNVRTDLQKAVALRSEAVDQLLGVSGKQKPVVNHTWRPSR